MKQFFVDNRTNERTVAYFSMEVGLNAQMATYSGGLGILAGDTIKSAADLHVPMVVVTLLNEQGFFHQKLLPDGWQEEESMPWKKEEFMTPLETFVKVNIQGREIKVKAWEYIVKGVNGYYVPILFLDSNVEGNSDWDRNLTSHLYGGDQWYRLCQEYLLGVAGVRMLHALGYTNVSRFHMNEGHAALLTFELFDRFKDIEEVRKRCVFTTHTPVPAGHDRYPMDMVCSAFPQYNFNIPEIIDHEGKLNMTLLGLHFSHYVNGVAKRHGEVSRDMFPGYHIDAITNGVHAATWISRPFKELFDRKIPGWSSDPFSLRYAMGIKRIDIWDAHKIAKKELIDYVNKKYNAEMNEKTFTIGFARRATPYKRADLLFHNVERLKWISSNVGKVQIIYGGKAHPSDGPGKELIKKIFAMKNTLANDIKIIYLDNYDMDVANMMVSGVDVWLNTPARPLEASGTSGMKAAHNGVPSLSILDGWWIEGHIENVTGWSIGPPPGREPADVDSTDANDLYEKLEKVILPMYYHDFERWVGIMRHAIAINASFFNTHRMVHQYVLNAYFQ